MNWGLAAILCIVLVEVAIRLPFSSTIRPFTKSAERAFRVLRSRAISDHWKEKALGSYARTTFVCSIQLASLLILLFIIGSIVVVAAEQLSAGFLNFIFRWAGIVFSVIVASVYVSLRHRRARG